MQTIKIIIATLFLSSHIFNSSNIQAESIKTTPGKLTKNRLKAFEPQAQKPSNAIPEKPIAKLEIPKEKKDIIQNYYEIIKNNLTSMKTYLKDIDNLLQKLDPYLIHLSIEDMKEDLTKAHDLYTAAMKLNTFNQTKRKQKSHPSIAPMKTAISQMESTLKKIDAKYQTFQSQEN